MEYQVFAEDGVCEIPFVIQEREGCLKQIYNDEAEYLFDTMLSEDEFLEALTDDINGVGPLSDGRLDNKQWTYRKTEYRDVETDNGIEPDCQWVTFVFDGKEIE